MSEQEVEVEIKEVQESGKKEFLPEIVLDIAKLPSRGVPYPVSAKVKYKTYTFGEVQEASTSNWDIVDSIKLALKGIEAEGGLDKYQLTLLDVLYIGILRKVSSMNELKFEMPYMCRGCMQKTKGIFSEKDIEFRDLSSDVIELPIKATIAGQELDFAPMTVKEFLDLHGGRHKNVIGGKVNKMSIYATMIKNLRFEESYKLLTTNRNNEDNELLEEIDRILLHDMKPLIATCSEEVEDEDGEKSKCGFQNALKLEGREALLRPFREGKGSARDRVRFSTKPSSEHVPH